MNDVTFIGRPAMDPVPTEPAAEPGFQQTAEMPILTQYWRIILRSRWLVLGALMFAIAIGVLVTLLATPQYTAATRIEVTREGSRIVNVEGVQPTESSVDQEFYQTQYGVLGSRSLAERVVRTLDLANNKDFFNAFGVDEAVESLDLGPVRAAAPAEREKRFRIAVEILLDRVKIEPIRLSRLVDIQWTSPDPALSAKVANAWANGFIEQNLERRFDQTAYARKFLEDRLEQIRARLDESERKLVGYASNEAIINIPVGVDGQGNTAERSLIADSLAALNEELARATGDRVRAESRLRSETNSAESAVNPTLSALRQRRAEAAAERQRLLSQFEPGYPTVQAQAALVEQLDRSIAREEGRIQGAIRAAYTDSVAREAKLIDRVNELKTSYLDQRRRSIQYNIFQRDVDTNRELYNGLLQRYKEIGVAGGVGANNVAIVDPARVPEDPSSPRPLLNLLLSLVAGLIIGVGIALIREQIDESITDPVDLERRVGLPLLGVIPKTDTDDIREELRDPKSSLIEAYLSAQTSLAFSTSHGVPRSIAVTSTRPAEGKSTTAFALAHSISRSGARTVLIDGDMRSPSVHGNLGLQNGRGLSNFLSGEEDALSLVQYLDNGGLAIITAGPQPPNAAELLRGERLTVLINELLRTFSHVVIDSPPVLGLADAPVIGSRVEATVYVVQAAGVRARVARVAISRMLQARARIVGVLLTKFDAQRAHYGYGYDYGYGYGGEEAA